MANYSDEEFTMTELAGELNTQLTVTIVPHKEKPTKRKPKKKKPRDSMLTVVNGELGLVTSTGELWPKPKTFDAMVSGEALGMKFCRTMKGVTGDVIKRFIMECKQHFEHSIRQEYEGRKLQLGSHQEDMKVPLK